MPLPAPAAHRSRTLVHPGPVAPVRLEHVAARGQRQWLFTLAPGQVLLPALPAAWPEGSVKGLKAKGAFLVDIAWKAGKVTSFKVASDSAEKVRVKVNGEIQTITAEKGEALLEFQGW